MIIRNCIQQTLEKMGIKAMIPSEDLLEKRLGGMSLRRFNKILANSSAQELTATEARNLTKWLAGITNQPEAAINLWEAAPVAQEEVAA